MIVREVWPFIALGGFLTILFAAMAARLNSMALFLLGVVIALLTLFTFFFFRDPDRTSPDEPDVLLAPADGKVVAVDTLANHAFIGGEAVQISVFLSVFDVHVNRVPASGVIDYVDYNPGKFHAAYEEKASKVNEQTEIGMTTRNGHKLVFKQIAGIIARRIVCNLNADDTVTAGSRFGLIRFGSRADLIVPADSKISVDIGEHVTAGQTIMGYLLSDTSQVRMSQSKEGGNAEL
jgi:phosphatidylserine decarboxylase